MSFSLLFMLYCKRRKRRKRMNRLLLVDGSNLLFQMFFGMPARIVNAQGKAIQGTLGFTGALLKIIRMVEPTHIAVLFDGEHANERSDANADYKANRPDYSQMPEEETPFSQLPDVYAALDCLRIPHAETTDCETDDWMAAYARRYGMDHQIVIASFDSDFFQLISQNVSVLRYRGKSTIVCTPDTIREKLQIEPAQYADFKALTGDSSDNLKGADKIGPKTAAMLLGQFGSLECILANVQKISKPSIRESLIRCTARVLRNQQLIRLNGTAALPFEWHEMVYHAQGLTTREVLKTIHLL